MAPSSDLLDHYKLEAHQVGDSVIHYSYRSNRASGLRKSKVEEKWDNVRPIGYGSFGEVWQQKRNSSNEQRAVKVLRKQQMKSWGINYEREIEALAKFDKAEFRQEEVIVQFFGWWESEHSVHLAMEYFERRDLSTFISEAKTSERDAKDIAGDLLQALVMVHSQGFTHRDLKPQNIFVVQTSPKYWVKLGDFGISKRMLNQSTALRSEVGTRAFLAPEATPDDYEETFQYTNAVDMWSLGCVIYNVLAHSLPYQNNRAKRFPFPTQPLKDRVSNQGINLLECLLRVDPSIRWAAQKAAKHPWLEASCEASSAPVKDAPDDANFVAQPKGTNEYQNRRQHPGKQVDMPTVISSTEKTYPRPADRTEPPVDQLASQSSSHHGENSQVDSGSNSDGRRRTTSDRLTPLSRRYSLSPIPPFKYRTSDSFVDEGTETLKPRRAGYHKSDIISDDLHQNDTTKKLTASPEMPTVVSKALNIGLGTSYGSSNVADEGATQGEPLVKVHYPSLAVRRRQESEEQGPENMELVTILQDIHTQEGDPKQTEVARALQLIHKGVDLKMRSDGETALHLAVQICCFKKKGHVTQILHELLQTGADVDVRNNHGQTALHTAVNCKFRNYGNYGNAFEAVKQLIRYKADVNAKDSSSRTPLHHAALFWSGEAIDVLLAAGARVNELSKYNRTALHEAACSTDYGKIVAKKLILAGIDMDIINDSGATALDIAHARRNYGVIKTIEKAQEQVRRQRQDNRTSHSSAVSPTVQEKEHRRLRSFHWRSIHRTPPALIDLTNS